MCVWKTDRTFWADATEEYAKRLKHYTKFSIHYLSDVKAHKKTAPTEIKNEEAKNILQKIKTGDVVEVVEDCFSEIGFEDGESFSEFSDFNIKTKYKVNAIKILFIILFN